MAKKAATSAPDRNAKKKEHKAHAEEFLTRDEHTLKPKGYPEPEDEFHRANP
jgi:hypothetical protein